MKKNVFNMKKNILLLIAGVMMMTSCGTYAGQGAADGAFFGSMLGSAIGGLNGGYRGHYTGQLLGMAGGALVGAAIGEAKDKAVQEDRQNYYEEKARLRANREARRQAELFDSSMQGDDSFEMQPSEGSTVTPLGPDGKVQVPTLDVRNIRFIDENGDGILSRGETADISMEIFNMGSSMAFNVEPVVVNTPRNKHILISQPIRIESLPAHGGVRYTAKVVADRALKNGVAQFSIAVKSAGQFANEAKTLNVQLSK